MRRYPKELLALHASFRTHWGKVLGPLALGGAGAGAGRWEMISFLRFDRDFDRAEMKVSTWKDTFGLSVEYEMYTILVFEICVEGSASAHKRTLHT